MRRVFVCRQLIRGLPCRRSIILAQGPTYQYAVKVLQGAVVCPSAPAFLFQVTETIHKHGYGRHLSQEKYWCRTAKSISSAHTCRKITSEFPKHSEIQGRCHCDSVKVKYKIKLGHVQDVHSRGRAGTSDSQIPLGLSNFKINSRLQCVQTKSTPEKLKTFATAARVICNYSSREQFLSRQHIDKRITA